MKVMVLVKASKGSEAGEMPSEQLLTEMGKYNEELVKAGIMLAGEGLHPTSKAKRVRFSGKGREVIDGPFTETKELVAGFWMWKVKSMDEAVEACRKVRDLPRTGVRSHFEGRFTAEVMVRKYVSAYEQLLAGQANVIKMPSAGAFSPQYGELNGKAGAPLHVAAMPA